jgi:hypothetical protein
MCQQTALKGWFIQSYMEDPKVKFNYNSPQKVQVGPYEEIRKATESLILTVGTARHVGLGARSSARDATM